MLVKKHLMKAKGQVCFLALFHLKNKSFDSPFSKIFLFSFKLLLTELGVGGLKSFFLEEGDSKSSPISGG